jgi:uncharacterized protein DUF4058
MPSPLPGMDPYIEAPNIWSDSHGDLAAEMRAELGAAQNWCWVGPKHWIDGDNGQPVLKGLTHQHAVKWIAVHSRQCCELTNTGFFQREARNLMAYALDGQIVLRRVWQRQLPEAMFDDRFPNANYAQKHRVSWVPNAVAPVRR